MKIRHKITLWFTGAGIFVTLLFSVVTFVGMLHIPFYLIDKELENMAKILIHKVSETDDADVFAQSALPHGLEKYWIKIYDVDLKMIYHTPMSDYADLPLYPDTKAYSFETMIPKEDIDLNQDAESDVAFRVNTIHASIHGRPYLIQIAKPMEEIEEEILGLLRHIAYGLLAVLFLLLGIGYFIAGKILEPVGIINRMAREISEKTLNRRIPLGQSRDELFTLSETLNKMFERLYNAFSSQKQFTASASHELKSPMTLMMLFLEDSVRRTDLPESYREKLDLQLHTLRRLIRLVKNLLDLSTLELKEGIDFTEFDLSALIKRVLDDYHDVLLDREIRVATHLPASLSIEGSRDHLHRVLVNLIDNAIKYNTSPGFIEMTLSEKDNTVFFTLFNTGRGIPAEDIDRVFEQFYRVEKSRSLHHGGSGLGLTIVKRIIELHSGSIQIKSEPKGETEVDIFLPQQR